MTNTNSAFDVNRAILEVIHDYSKFKHSVRITIPSTCNVDEKLPTELINQYRTESINKMNEIFGGSTAFHGLGSFLYTPEDENGNVNGDSRHVQEEILLIESFVNIESKSQLIEVIQYAEYLVEQLTQDSILVGFNDYNFFVTKPKI
jgi:hypothetical protein